MADRPYALLTLPSRSCHAVRSQHTVVPSRSQTRGITVSRDAESIGAIPNVWRVRLKAHSPHLPVSLGCHAALSRWDVTLGCHAGMSRLDVVRVGVRFGEGGNRRGNQNDLRSHPPFGRLTCCDRRSPFTIE